MSDINTTPLVDVMLVLLIIFLIAVPVAIQTIEKLQASRSSCRTESKDKVENLLLTVSTTDDGGRSAGEPGFEGASRNGECRIYFNNITPVNSTELRDQAFKRLDAIVKREGGPEALKANPDKIPQVHIRGDVERAVALRRGRDLQRADLRLSDRRLHLEPGRSRTADARARRPR